MDCYRICHKLSTYCKPSIINNINHCSGIRQWGYCSFNTIYQETEQQQIIVMPVVVNTRIPIGVINCGNVEYWSQASPSLNINSSNLRVWNKGTQNQPIPAGLQIRWIFLCF